MNRRILLPLIGSVIFFILGFWMLSDYGINWDEAIHYNRGQAYLHFLLTGQKEYPWLKEGQDDGKRHSMYQTTFRQATYYLSHDSGHPPLSDMLASVTNIIFFQKLGWLGDIESYHVFVLLTASWLIYLVMRFAYEEYGPIASIVSGLSLALYPLFLSESHFNIKDPAESAFYATAIIFWYWGFKHQNRRFMLISAVAAGMAFATKFNALFLPFILFPWTFMVLGLSPRRYASYLVGFVIYPFIVGGIFLASWPFLWHDTLTRLLYIFGYYKDIGTTESLRQPASYYLFSFNTYPWQYILFTTPLCIIVYAFIGGMRAFISFQKEHWKPTLLILLWLFIPILRVTPAKATIYAGVRQIMEFIPALALLAGAGAQFITTWLEKYLTAWFKKLKLGRKVTVQQLATGLQLLVIASFIPIAIKLIQIHPNENVYFNPLIGGLSGAKAKNFHSWGSNLGSSYRSAVKWLNIHAEKGANVALVINTGANIPRSFFRSDIHYDNGLWSGPAKQGEYLVEAIYDGWIREYFYAGEYVDRLLVPVYEVTVDGVAIVKVWKNDEEHTVRAYRKEHIVHFPDITYEKTDNSLSINLPKPLELFKILIQTDDHGCTPISRAHVFLSNGTRWNQEQEDIFSRRFAGGEMIQDGLITYLLAAKPAQQIKITTDNPSSCLFHVGSISIDGIPIP